MAENGKYLGEHNVTNSWLGTKKNWLGHLGHVTGSMYAVQSTTLFTSVNLYGILGERQPHDNPMEPGHMIREIPD